VRFGGDAETNTRDACAPRKSGATRWLIALLLLLRVHSFATDPDTFSPVVSYQYLDSLAAPDAPTTITSPVVSYQYFDWIGDENVTFQYSSNVSYYFSGGVVAAMTGSVRTIVGAPIAGAAVTLKRGETVFWTGTSGAGGTFIAPQLQATNYLMTVSKAGYQSLMKTIAGYHGGNGTLDVTLAPAPAPLATLAVNRITGLDALTGVEAPNPSDEAAPTLKVFDGTDFVPYDPANPPAGVTLYPNRMTVVTWCGTGTVRRANPPPASRAPRDAEFAGYMGESAGGFDQDQPSRQRAEYLVAAGPGNQPAYAWLTVNVPQNAGFLAFDFTVTGDPKDDRVVCAINEMNVFSLAAKFAPAGVPSSTDLIDVSAFAGQDIELFFGLAGGTSTNCEVAIDGIRFITIPHPKIGIVDAAPNLLLKWPAAATGWVLEATDSLALPDWQPVPMATSVTVDSGVVTFQQPKTSAQKFYRLRRMP